MPVIIVFFICFVCFVDLPDVNRWYEKIGWVFLYFFLCVFYASSIATINIKWIISDGFRPKVYFIYSCVIWPLSFLVPLFFLEEVAFNSYGFVLYALVSVLIAIRYRAILFDYMMQGFIKNNFNGVDKIKSDFSLLIHFLFCVGLPTGVLFFIK